MLAALAPRAIKPMGRTVDVRIYSGACTTGGGASAVALFFGQGTEFTVLLEGIAEMASAGSHLETNEISGLVMFAIVAAVGP